MDLRIGVYFKPFSKLASDVALKVIDECIRRGAEVYVEESLLNDKNLRGMGLSIPVSIGRFSLSNPAVDIIAVIGGDGTLLRVLHTLRDPRIPIMAIRMGRRGFLLDVTPLEISERIGDLIEGRYKIVSYLRLRAASEVGELPPALNEIAVVSIGTGRSKVVRLKVYKDDKFLYYMEGDGIIVATPVGSTAYSMAAGGPILDHELRAFVITPLAPVNIWIRPMVINAGSTIKIILAEDSAEAYAIADGQESIKLNPQSSITITVHNEPARIIRFHDISNVYERIFPRS